MKLCELYYRHDSSWLIWSQVKSLLIGYSSVLVWIQECVDGTNPYFHQMSIRSMFWFYYILRGMYPFLFVRLSFILTKCKHLNYFTRFILARGNETFLRTDNVCRCLNGWSDWLAGWLATALLCVRMNHLIGFGSFPWNSYLRVAGVLEILS